MDSLTQIVLGASMGEMVAGRKIGNRAMIWGAAAGTIPDLDVFISFFGVSPEVSLAFHRSISHSLFFAVLAPLLYTIYVRWLYKKEHHNRPGFKWSTTIACILFLIFCGTIVNLFPVLLTKSVSWVTLIITLSLLFFLSKRLLSRYTNAQQAPIEMSNLRWYLLFFIATITHPLLDCCTGYGTQLFQPFSDIRISWNNISVADPLYTVPFLIFLLIAANLHKKNKWRTILNYTGIAWSILYLSWTVYNKNIVDQVFEDSLQKQQVEYSRCMTTPTILNNLLWHCVAEGDSVYYDGFYSIRDKLPIVELVEIKKNHELIELPEDKRFQTLRWFSDEYYSVIPLSKDTLQINDLRYGPFIGGDPNKADDYVFTFKLARNGDRYDLITSEGGPPEDQQNSMFSNLWNRMMGK